MPQACPEAGPSMTGEGSLPVSQRLSRMDPSYGTAVEKVLGAAFLIPFSPAEREFAAGGRNVCVCVLGEGRGL